jgi:HSP20 family protein
MAVITWRPLWDTRFPSLRDEMDKMFEEFFEKVSYPSTREHSWSPALDVYETKTDVVITVDIPGADPKEVAISILEDKLTIKGEREKKPATTEGEYYRAERAFGVFQRLVQLPCPVMADRATAAYIDGVLTITVPKLEKTVPREVKVEVR